MTRTATHLTWALVALLAVPPHLYAQAVAGPDIWRAFVERLDPGTTLKVRLKSGPGFRATLLQVSADAMIVQPKTRAAVPPQQVPFADIETLELDQARGVGLGKAAAIGAAVGAAVWLALMALTFAVWAD